MKGFDVVIVLLWDARDDGEGWICSRVGENDLFRVDGLLVMDSDLPSLPNLSLSKEPTFTFVTTPDPLMSFAAVPNLIRATPSSARVEPDGAEDA